MEEEKCPQKIRINNYCRRFKQINSISFNQDQLHGDAYECDALGAVDFVHYSIRLYLVVDLRQLHSNLLFDGMENDESLL